MKSWVLERDGWLDVLYLVALWVGTTYAFLRYSAHMDGYEQFILALAAVIFSGVPYVFKSLRVFLIAVAVCSVLAIVQYNGALSAAGKVFLLKYFLASQSAIMWMSVLFLLATLLYWVALLVNAGFLSRVASRLVWVAVLSGFVGMMVRWYESYLIAPDVGHIPVSNLYEVFILFTLLTALIYLYFETKYFVHNLGGFVMVVISAAVVFILWYTWSREAQHIQPLVPALQSYWMKIHVPANFIGYGAFSLAAAIGVVYLLSSHGIAQTRFPDLVVLDDLMYKAISIGFIFFTLATILGAMWAAEAWGGYWSWDPKETWALIVWLNYAAWLHLRLVKGYRGDLPAWWAVIGLLVTSFAFLGVNLFLSGLHSYGEL